MPRHQTRTTRVGGRIVLKARAVVKRASELHGRNVSEIMVSAAQDATQRAIEEAQFIRLAVEDQCALAEAIVNPPVPNAALKKAAALYRSLVTALR